jgi:hypothetical protein
MTVARTAAKNSFRIQITSFATQTRSRRLREGASLEMGDGRPGAERRRKARSEGPGHRNQLHPSHSRTQTAQGDANPSGRKCQESPSDKSRHDGQSDSDNADDADGQHRSPARRLELSLGLVDRRPPSRAALCALTIDGSRLLT